MRNIYLLMFFLFALTVNAQKPFEELGLDNEVELLTLSDGRYVEHFTNDTLRQIGSVMFNIVTNKVAYFIADDELEKMNVANRNREVSRFMSVDPIAEEFAWNSPYSYAENDVIRSIDLDGLEKVYYTLQAKDLWKSFMKVLNNDEVLKKTLWTSITKPELKEKVYVYYTTSSSLPSLGRTIDNNQLVGYAKTVLNYEALPESHWMKKDIEAKEDYKRTKSLLEDAGLNATSIIALHKKGIKQHAIIVNPNEQSELDQIKTAAHEIEFHLKNDLEGGEAAKKDAYQEHKDAFGEDYYNEKGISPYYSPPHDETPENSKAGKMYKKIDNAYKKDEI